MTHENFDLGTAPAINASYNAVVSFNGSTANVFFSSPVLVGADFPGSDSATGASYSVTKVSDLEYLVTAEGIYIDIPADVYADLKLASPLPATPGVLQVLPTSTIELATRFHQFTGDIEFATTAVPEASTWAMMLAGIGAIGAAVRRRRVAFRAAAAAA